MRSKAAPAALLLAGLLAGRAGAEGDDLAFMPPGGKAILSENLVPGDAAALAAAAERAASAEDWAAWARERNPDLSDAAIETFAGYAALNFPVGADIARYVGETGDASRLPPDGNELAVAQCQFCHSLFSGYLMQDRDEVSWKGTFKAPFHAEIPMSEVERDTFAHYSAINMPLKYQDVPPELRF